METLYIEEIKEDDIVIFVLKHKKKEHYVEFNMEEVTEWESDESISKTEPYLRGTVKWDGCMHLWFGDNGYMHFCGKRDIERHKKVMDTLCEIFENKAITKHG